MSRRLATFVVIGLLAACGGGIKETPAHRDLSGDAALAALPEPLRRSVDRAARAPEKDRTLALMRLAVDALQLEHPDIAFRALERVFASLNTIYADTARARQARSLWYEEGAKDFKGEPYERAMAGYYYGLLFLQRHDYGNAQAAFRFGAFQDAIAEEHQYESDFALLFYLQALALRLQDRHTVAAAAPLERVRRLRPDLAEPSPDHNVLIVVETGRAPRKVTDGVGHTELRYFRGRGFRENGAVVTIGDQAVPLYPIEDIWWQATTRGGRLVDRINQGKLEFRTKMDDVGTALTAASQVALFGADSREGTAVGIGAGVAGSVALITAAATQTAADDRAWDNLPDAVHLAQVALPPGDHQLRVRFFASGTPTDEPPPIERRVTVTERPLTVVWVRSRQQLSGERL